VLKRWTTHRADFRGSQLFPARYTGENEMMRGTGVTSGGACSYSPHPRFLGVEGNAFKSDRRGPGA